MVRNAALGQGEGYVQIGLGEVPDAATLRELLESARADSTCRAAVIAGDSWNPPDGTPPGARLHWLEGFELPTLFAFDGELAGPAFDVALACDIRVCGPSATIRASSIGTARLLQLIGQHGSVALMQRRGRLDAGAALTMGLVSAVAGDGQSAEAKAAELAGIIARRGPIATRLAKEAIWRGLEMPMEQALRFETDLTLLLQTTKDRAEGVRAFMEKRAPQFTGE